MNRTSPIVSFLFFTLLLGCQPPREQQADQEAPATIDDQTITSFLGETLPPKSLTEAAKKKLEEDLAIAERRVNQYPDSLDLIIWYGRRLAYLGRYLDAIDVYSNGLARFPNSYRLRRHRGHRYITTRQIDLAIKDFEMAVFYSTNTENQIEPDGIPNRLNKPLGNDQFNIWYHFGLAHFLNGRFDKAISAYTNCLEYSDNDDLLAATSYWLYLSAKRIGNEELAAQTLVPIQRKMRIIENTAYHDLLQLYKGSKTADQVLKVAENDQGQVDPTRGYGIGNWYLHQGEMDEARNLFWRILESPSWDAFGYIATEADIKNMATSAD